MQSRCDKKWLSLPVLISTNKNIFMIHVQHYITFKEDIINRRNYFKNYNLFLTQCTLFYIMQIKCIMYKFLLVMRF